MDGVGIDLLEIERLERALERRPRLAERLFTEGERAYAQSRARPVMHLAARSDLFPQLWEIRSRMTAEWGGEGRHGA